MKLTDEGRRDDLSPYVEEICGLFLSNELVRLRKDMVERLIAKRSELKRRDDLGAFVEWICEQYFVQEAQRQQAEDVGVAAGFTDKVRKNEQRKAI